MRLAITIVFLGVLGCSSLPDHTIPVPDYSATVEDIQHFLDESEGTELNECPASLAKARTKLQRAAGIITEMNRDNHELAGKVGSLINRVEKQHVELAGVFGSKVKWSIIAFIIGMIVGVFVLISFRGFIGQFIPGGF